MEFTFKTKIWLYPGDAAWHFVTLPKDASADIRHITTHSVRRGFRSVKVRVTSDGATWLTSIFPDSQSGYYLLPIKKPVRKSMGWTVGDTISLTVSLQ